MNYYIFTVESPRYLEIFKIKGESVGFLIAMTPLGGIISSFIYSYWSNYYFKWPLF